MTIKAQRSPAIEISDPVSILRPLPPPPARALLCGAGLEAMAAALSARGYDLTWGDASSCEMFPVAAEYATEPQMAVIVDTLASEIDALTLFSGSYDLLTMGGVLVLLAPAARRGLNRRDYLAMVAVRHGGGRSRFPTVTAALRRLLRALSQNERYFSAEQT